MISSGGIQANPATEFAKAWSRLLSVMLLLLCAAAANVSAAERVTSPDGKVVVTLALQADGTPVYSITHAGKPRVLESRLGFEPDFTNGFTQVGIAVTRSYSIPWTN